MEDAYKSTHISLSLIQLKSYFLCKASYYPTNYTFYSLLMEIKERILNIQNKYI